MIKYLFLFLLILNSVYSNPNEELLEGAKTGNFALVKRAIENKADLETRNSEGETALILASWYGSSEIVDYLIKVGAFINAQDKTGFTAIAKASCLGINRHFEIVENLISASANLNLKTKEGLSPFLLARIYGHENLAKILLKAGANEETFLTTIDASKEILNSSRLNDKERFQYASYFKPDLNYMDSNGITPLMYASRNGNKFIASALLKKGSKLDLKDNAGKTALMYAARRGHKEILILLIDKGADFELKDNQSNSALIWAEKFGQTEIAKFLRIMIESSNVD